MRHNIYLRKVLFQVGNVSHPLLGHWHASIPIHMHGTSSYLKMIHTLSQVCVPIVGEGGGKDLCHSSKLEAKMFWISYNLKIMIFRACISNYWLSSEYYIFPLIDHMCPLNLQFTYFEHTLQSYFQMHVLWVPFLDPNLTTHHSSIVECNMLQLLEVYFITTI